MVCTSTNEISFIKIQFEFHQPHGNAVKNFFFFFSNQIKSKDPLKIGLPIILCIMLVLVCILLCYLYASYMKGFAYLCHCSTFPVYLVGFFS